MTVDEKLSTNIDRYVISGNEILKDWKSIAESLEKIDNDKKKKIKNYFSKIFCIYNCSDEVK